MDQVMGLLWVGLPLGPWPLAAGHFWFSLFLQGFCTEMCLLCPSYPPCTGRNHSPGDDQVSGPAWPLPQVGPRSWAPVGGMRMLPPHIPQGRGLRCGHARRVHVSLHELETVALSSFAHGCKDRPLGLLALQAEVVGGAHKRRMQSMQETPSGGAPLLAWGLPHIGSAPSCRAWGGRTGSGLS